jgi:uncharacterized membrane protein YjfL (UPF0719 family)
MQETQTLEGNNNMEALAHYLPETFNVLWWTIVGVVSFYLGSWLFDWLDPIDYKVQIENGNIAAAIKLSAVLLGIAAIIITAIR